MTCFRCGRKGHYADECYANTSVGGKRFYSNRHYYDDDEPDLQCFRCGRTGHFADSCYAKTRVNGVPLSSQCSSGYSSSRPAFFPSPVRMNEAPMKLPRKREGVYVLQMSGDTLQYVGKSTDIDSRINDHREGFGALCIPKGMPGMGMTEIAPITSGSTDDMESWERNETLTRMKLYGISKVRGWMFTSTNLSEDDKRSAFRQICEKFDLCRRCGRNSHFAEECFAATADSWANDMRLE